METTYWDGYGTHQELVKKLNELIPVMGEIKGSKNVNLERFRKAQNAYYDIFNNGGMNRGHSISKFFGSGVTYYLRQNRKDYHFFNSIKGWNRIHELTEPKMDKLILAAAREQGLI